MLLFEEKPVLVPENRLLAELYLANKAHYHAKSRVVVGEKNGETSQVTSEQNIQQTFRRDLHASLLLS